MASSKIYCLLTEAKKDEQLAQSLQAAKSQQPDVPPTMSQFHDLPVVKQDQSQTVQVMCHSRSPSNVGVSIGLYSFVNQLFLCLVHVVAACYLGHLKNFLID